MINLWENIILISVASTVSAVIVLFSIHFSDKRKRVFLKEKLQKREYAKLCNKYKELTKVYFELKDNINILKGISELLKKKNLDPIEGQLKKIGIDEVLCFSRKSKMNRKEFDVIDKIHNTVLIKNKIELFYMSIPDLRNNHLEFRAEIDKSVDYLEEVRKNLKETFVEV